MPSPCYVCGVVMVGVNYHHVIPQADGGVDGPQVPVCASCHTAVHVAARRLTSGRSADAALGHLTEDQRDSAMALAQIAAAAHRNAPSNPNPLLSVVLDDPAYMRALDRFRADHGFTSRAAALNSMLRGIATHYGLVDEADQTREIGAKRTSISAFRGGGISDAGSIE